MHISFKSNWATVGDGGGSGTLSSKHAPLFSICDADLDVFKTKFPFVIKRDRERVRPEDDDEVGMGLIIVFAGEDVTDDEDVDDGDTNNILLLFWLFCKFK